jgi:hypothetical protein
MPRHLSNGCPVSSRLSLQDFRTDGEAIAITTAAVSPFPGKNQTTKTMPMRRCLPITCRLDEGWRVTCCGQRPKLSRSRESDPAPVQHTGRFCFFFFGGVQRLSEPAVAERRKLAAVPSLPKKGHGQGHRHDGIGMGIPTPIPVSRPAVTVSRTVNVSTAIIPARITALVDFLRGRWSWRYHQ